MKWVYLFVATLWTLPVSRIAEGKWEELVISLTVLAFAWCSGCLFGRDVYKPAAEEVGGD